MRHRTGIHNKYRSGRSTYNVRRKSLDADRYGTYTGGRMTNAERIAGTRIDKQLPGLWRH